MLIKLGKFFKDGPISWIILGILSNLDSSIENSHDKGSIISTLTELDIFHYISQTITIYAYIQIIAYLDATVENKIVLDIVCPIDSRYNLSHAKITSCYWCLWVAISKID